MEDLCYGEPPPSSLCSLSISLPLSSSTSSSIDIKWIWSCTALDPEAQKVRQWHHKLLIKFRVTSNGDSIKAEVRQVLNFSVWINANDSEWIYQDMPDMASLFTTLEGYEDMTAVLMKVSTWA